MKKFLYFALLTAAITATLAACAEAPNAADTSDGKFMDYKLVTRCPSADMRKLGAAGNKAVKLIKETDFYKELATNFSAFDKDGSPMTEPIVIYPYDYDGDGPMIEPTAAYPYDYDGDGRTETFIIAEVLWIDTENDNMLCIHNYALFADSGGTVTMLPDIGYSSNAALIEYDSFKHIVIGNYECQYIYGVKDGKAEKLSTAINDSNGVDAVGCFLGAGRGLIYYDAAAGKYLAVKRRTVPIEDIKAMDKDNALAKYYEAYDETGYWDALILGDRFYVFSDEKNKEAAYEYIDGKFVQTEDSEQIRS